MKFLLCSEEGRRSSEGGLQSIAAKQLTRQISVVKSKGRAVAASGKHPGIFEGMALQRSKSAIAGFP